MAESSRPGLALLCFVIPAMLWPSPAEAAFGNPAKGQSLFVSKGCVECHAVRGAGGRIGPDLGRTAVKGSFYEIAAALWNHSLTMSDKMKEFRLVRPSFRDDELADLLAFLYFLNYFDEPGDPKVGKVLFAQKHCIQCHQIDLGGNPHDLLHAFPAVGAVAVDGTARARRLLVAVGTVREPRGRVVRELGAVPAEAVVRRVVVVGPAIDAEHRFERSALAPEAGARQEWIGERPARLAHVRKCGA